MELAAEIIVWTVALSGVATLAVIIVIAVEICRDLW